MSNDRVEHFVVMGGTSGIGRAAALRFASLGARVSVVGRSPERGAEVARNPRVHFFAADLAEPGAAAEVVERIVSDAGPFDAAVNAAASSALDGPQRLHELDASAFEHHLVRELRVCEAPLRAELAHAMAHPERRVRIVNVGSVNGLGASPRAPYYSAAKAAQLALTKNAALDYAADGIRVNAVVLGAFDTPMLADVYRTMCGGNDDLAGSMRARFLGLVPLGRVGTPDEAAAVISWLCSTESSYVTGAAWIVDGGLTSFAR